MNFFSSNSGNKPEKRVLKFGIPMMPSFQLIADERFLEARNEYNQKIFRVSLADIDGVSVDQGSWGKSAIKIMGKGNVLAETKIVTSWAEKAQEFVMDEIDRKKAAV
jgi:hypothetical protein